jgi:lysophospholipase L1-like esterase
MGKEDVEEEPEISIEEIVAMSEKTAQIAAEKDSLLSFFSTSPTRFYLPNNDLHFFDPLYKELENADKRRVRVLHYGDSQLEEDRMTFVIRDTLQSMFGGDGQGMMPARSHYTFSMAGSANGSITRYMIYAPDKRCGGNKYGPFGDFVRLSGSARLNYSQSKRADARRRLFNEVTVVAGNTSGKGLSVTLGDSTIRFNAGENLVRAVFSVPDSSDKVSLSVSGNGDIYGVLMDTKTGVAVDNIPMRGCSGTIFTAMNPDQLRSYYEQENVRLIFLQYGGNSVPVIKNSKQVSNYCATMRNQINHVQSLVPNAKVVLIGPSDMGKRTWSIIPQLVDSLICTANSCGAAYWDIFGAMGGKYSMAKWVSKGLAGSDYIHFSTKGSKLMASNITDSFKLYYEYYLWRKENEE